MPIKNENTYVPDLPHPGRMVTIVLLADRTNVGQLSACMESILQQQTSFNYEIIIAFFGHPDEVADACQEYVALYPGKVRFYISLKGNSENEYIHIDSPYLVLSNGTEQWIDLEKLEKQVSFLQKNSSYSLCFHNVKYNETEQSPSQTRADKKNYKTDGINLSHLLKYYSALFRTRHSRPEYPFRLIKKEGYELFVRQVKPGKIKCLSHVMSLLNDLTEEEIKNIDQISPTKKWHYYL